MTKEELNKKLREKEEKFQNEYIDMLYTDISFLCEISMKKTYDPTDYERYIFSKIKVIIDNMSKWF